jgi:hypothetical protein
VTGADLNGLAGDSYSYGVERMDVGSQSFSTDSGRADNSGSSSGDDDEEENI